MNSLVLSTGTEGLTVQALVTSYNLNLMGISNVNEPQPPQNEGRADCVRDPHKLYNHFYKTASKISSNGMFAGYEIKEGEIMYFPTPEISQKEYDKVKESEREFFLTTEDKIYDLRDSILRYLNHSKTPNIDWRNGLELVALRYIAKDEELTIDYGWEEYPWDNNQNSDFTRPIILCNMCFGYLNGDESLTMGKGDRTICESCGCELDDYHWIWSDGRVMRRITELNKWSNENKIIVNSPKESKLTRFKKFLKNIL